jgi:hypothetical protein
MGMLSKHHRESSITVPGVLSINDSASLRLSVCRLAPTCSVALLDPQFRMYGNVQQALFGAVETSDVMVGEPDR